MTDLVEQMLSHKEGREKCYENLRKIVIDERDRELMCLDTNPSHGKTAKQINERCKLQLAFLNEAIALMNETSGGFQRER